MIYSEVKYQPERSCTFLGSPSVVRLPDGALLATHDYFGPGCPRNHENEESLISVYRSEDDGQSWQNITHIMNAYWSTLFVHAGAVYLFGTTQQYGSIVIRRSTDGGFRWTHPVDGKSGQLFSGGYYHEPPNYHCAPVPVLNTGRRLYRAFEDCSPCNWPDGFQSCVVSVDTQADLLDAASWTMSNKVVFNPAWTPDTWPTCDRPGWLEGNVVQAPDGELWNILRFHATPSVDKAARLSLSPDGTTLSFAPETGFVDLPGGMTKFTIRRDADTGRYLALLNNNTDPARPGQRNVLSLYASSDLWTWEHVTTLLTDESGLAPEDSVRLTGFQYVDWQFDGADIIYLVRMAFRGSRNFHDANRITFHRINDFRALLS
ncbi:MAG: exo-alpha-sialidase [Lentisphaerae bacterium]|nr:exo-alpha-sialidase [Lentisphaerota bacterium]MBT5607259.1 exo-alpha-sialidase [Lentisphaerota bacterium]MBT7058812.1 exo-alpha-sialidase [Lentisphaerota bacterium]MBT7842378.1 exo-alpha-sialidase [Lentisphaerota bacterium]